MSTLKWVTTMRKLSEAVWRRGNRPDIESLRLAAVTRRFGKAEFGCSLAENGSPGNPTELDSVFAGMR